MNTSDSKKLTDAIEALTRQLRSGGTGPSSPSSPSPIPTSTSTPGQLDALSYLEKQNEEYEKQLKIVQMVNDANSLNEQQQNDLYDKLEQKLDKTYEEEELRKRVRELQIVGNTVMEDNLKLQEDANKAIAKTNEGLDKQRKKQEELLELDRKRKRELEDISDDAENLARQLGSMIGLKEKQGGFTGALTNLIGLGGKGAFTATLGGLASGFASLMNPAALAAAGIGLFVRVTQGAAEAVVFFALKFDALGAEIAKTTGHGRVFAEEIVGLSSANKNAMISTEEMTKAVVSLGNELTGVNGITLETTARLGKMAVNAERMGVSMQDFGKFVKDAMVGGGMSADQAQQSFSNLNKASELMNVNFSELSSEFLSSRTTFSAYGQNMEKVFLRTSSVARQMGVELGTVLGMSDKFKTFEDSAAFVSEFNHMVGASLDPLEMMRLRAQEGPDAVAKAMQDSLQMSGKSFDELSFAMREGIADSLGIPMNELRNMMESDVDISLADEVENASQPMDVFMEKGEAAMTILEKIGKLLISVADKFAIAFGFDQFSGKGLDQLFTTLKDFIDEDLSGTIMNDFAPFVKMDLPKMVETVTGFVKSIINSPTIQELLGIDPLEQKREEYAELGRQLKGNITTTERKSIQDQMSTLKKEYNDQATDMSLAQNIMSFGGLNPFAAGIFTLSNMMTKKDISAMPGQADGGPVLKGGLAMVGERGPEVVSMPTGAYTIPNNAFARTGSPHSNSSSTSGGGQPVQVNVRIDANDRVLKNAFTTTVEDVITGGA